MKIAKWLSNRITFAIHGRINDGYLRQQTQDANRETFAQFLISHKQQAQVLTNEEMLDLYNTPKAATHETDQAAGGDHHKISGLGGSAENSHIGRNWNANSEGLDPEEKVSNIKKIENAVAKVKPEKYKDADMKVQLETN